MLYFKCPVVAVETDPCGGNAGLISEAQSACDLLNNNNGAFKTCIKSDTVNNTQFFVECVHDYCSASRKKKDVKPVVCNSLAALAAECSNNFITVNWRTADRCRKIFELKSFQARFDKKSIIFKRKHVQMV